MAGIRYSVHRNLRDTAVWLSARLKHQGDEFSPVEHHAIQQVIVALNIAASEVSPTEQDRSPCP